MKNVLLLTLAFCIGFLGYSQDNSQYKKQLRDTYVTLTKKMDVKEEAPFNNVIDATVRSGNTAPNETVIGNTLYDLQTNTMLSGRIHMHEDGTVGAVWTQGLGAAPGFTDRGTGYNYFDGASWGPAPTNRIETVRTGWPNYAPWGVNGEVVVSHNGVNGLQISKRANKGTGAWEESLYQGPTGIEDEPTWPRLAVGGENNETLHMLFNSYVAYNGQTTALLYSRSEDGGETWDPQDVTFDEFGPSYYNAIGGDSYLIAARGNTVAILIADTWDTDLAMLKSEDNGETWTHTIIWEHPYPFYDWNVTITDTFFSVDGSASMAIGPDGKVHVVFGICRVLHDVVGTTYNLWPYAEGIGYWNEDMPVFSNGIHALAPPIGTLSGDIWSYEDSELVKDVSYIGWMQDLDGNNEINLLTEIHYYRSIGACSWPVLTVDDNNDIFLAYSAITEGFDNTVMNYRHIWSRGFANNSWGPFVDLTIDIFHIIDECIYPVLSPTSNDDVHLLYQVDNTPGLALDDDHEYLNNLVYYSAVPKSDLLTGINEKPTIITPDQVSQNYPNPFSGVTTVSVNLQQSANLSLEVINIMGQQVMLNERGQVNAGTYYLQFDATELPSGVYFYTVKADNNKVTKKMVVR